MAFNPYRNAGHSHDPAKILKVTLSPDPPQKGKDLTVAADVLLSKYAMS